MLKSYVSYIYVKAALWENQQVVSVRFWDGHVEKILIMLKESGYQGFLSLEPHLSDVAPKEENEWRRSVYPSLPITYETIRKMTAG